MNFASVLDTFESGLQQEKGVTKNFYELTDLAWEEKEHATISFLRWFLDEQVEEEASFDTHIEYLKRIGEDKNALYIYEKELGQRQFSQNPENELVPIFKIPLSSLLKIRGIFCTSVSGVST